MTLAEIFYLYGYGIAWIIVFNEIISEPPREILTSMWFAFIGGILSWSLVIWYLMAKYIYKNNGRKER